MRLRDRVGVKATDGKRVVFVFKFRRHQSPC
jgi:hypothetical protein